MKRSHEPNAEKWTDYKRRATIQIAVGRNARRPARLRGEKLYVTTQLAAFACRNGILSLSVRHVHVTTQYTACAYPNRMPPVNRT